jgi:cell division protein FtsB
MDELRNSWTAYPVEICNEPLGMSVLRWLFCFWLAYFGIQILWWTVKNIYYSVESWFEPEEKDFTSDLSIVASLKSENEELKKQLDATQANVFAVGQNDFSRFLREHEEQQKEILFLNNKIDELELELKTLNEGTINFRSKI